MTPWTDWSDDEFLGYCGIHCETDRALFSWEMAVKLHDMAGLELTTNTPPPGFIAMPAEVAKPLIKTARERLAA
jgi:hypothetical protein